MPALYLGRQRANQYRAFDRKNLADLPQRDLGFAADDAIRRSPAANQNGFLSDLGANAEPVDQTRHINSAAAARGGIDHLSAWPDPSNCGRTASNTC